jgi:hypothetical protein
LIEPNVYRNPVTGRVQCFTCRRAAAAANTFACRSPLGRAGIVDVFDPLTIFVRDRWRCRICGGGVSPRKIGLLTPNAPTIDHVEPVGAGGVHSLENVRLAHKKCNSRRDRHAA